MTSLRTERHIDLTTGEIIPASSGLRRGYYVNEASEFDAVIAEMKRDSDGRLTGRQAMADAPWHQPPGYDALVGGGRITYKPLRGE